MDSQMSQMSREDFISKVLAEKESLRENFRENAGQVESFYRSIKGLSLFELKEIFPAPRAVVEQSIYDATSEIISAQNIEECAFASISLFRPKTVRKSDPELFKKDMELLQALFFFLIRELFGSDEKNELALNDGSWCEAEKQAEILNHLSGRFDFCKKQPFTTFDFTSFEGNHFEANESILRLFSSFAPDCTGGLPKEKIINEVNFVREQQKSLLQIFPNTRKNDYSESGAKKEIAEKLKNLESLKKLDFGFTDPDFTQNFFAGDDNLKNPFSRKITCKFFQESEMEWKDEKPQIRYNRRGIKIIARKSDRATNKSALRTKFLYPERNMITHISENFAVYNLFGKEYLDFQMPYWERLVLSSLFDAREYLKELGKEEGKKENSEKLLRILNHYFQKICSKLELPCAGVDELWSAVFDDDGDFKINAKMLGQTNLYNEALLNEDEITHLRKFLSFLYCTGNEKEDFFEKNKSVIQIYLIYLTFEFSKMDKGENTEKI